MPTTVHRTTVTQFEWSDGSQDRAAVQLSCSALESDLPAGGGTVSVTRTTLSDNSTRVLVLYALDPANINTFASNSTKRNAIGSAIKAAAETL